MSNQKSRPSFAVIRRRLEETSEVLQALQFGAKQSNELAAYVTLAILNLGPDSPWSHASSPLMGITPLISFIADNYRQQYAPNTRETVRDEAIKYFVEYGMVIRNPDDPARPTNSMKTVYQIEPAALVLFQNVDSPDWPKMLETYLRSRDQIRSELDRKRQLAVIPVRLPDGSQVSLSPGGQNPLMKLVVEEFCPRFVPGGTIVYLGESANKFAHLDANYLAELGIVLASADKIPDVVIHDARREWLVLVEVVTTAGPIDGKRRKELKALFENSKAGLVFVSAFDSRKSMQSFLGVISWETEVWVADNPDHLIHFNGERFLGPYPDVSKE